MQYQAGRFIINLTGKGGNYFLWNGTESYYKKLRSAYSDIVNDNKSEYLYFGFFSLCAATLEYSLNFVIADYCVNKYGPERYKEYCEGYMSLPFRKKLFMLPIIVSDGVYEINESNNSYKLLEELITLRNRILHNKEFLKDFDFPEIGAYREGDNLVIPADKTNVQFEFEIATNHIDTLSKNKCIDFGNALGDFKKYIMTPAIDGNLEVNPMIIKQVR
jgi:hypothetical protein